MSRFDGRGKANRVLLVGVSEYDHTKPPHGVPGDLPAVRHNLDRLRDVLQRGGVFGASELVLLRSPYTHDFEHQLRRVAEEAEGLLLVYFAGHGAIPSAGDELFLQLRGAGVYAGEAAVFPGAEMFTTVLGMLGTSRAERIVVVLDCCFAGNAAWIWEHVPDRRRVLLLTSVQANHRIDAGDPATPTPFTALLAELLAGEGEVWFGRLAEDLRTGMRAAGLRTIRDQPWEPLSRTEPGEDVLLSARGVARPGSPAQTPPDRRALPGTASPGTALPVLGSPGTGSPALGSTDTGSLDTGSPDTNSLGTGSLGSSSAGSGRSGAAEPSPGSRPPSPGSATPTGSTPTASTPGTAPYLSDPDPDRDPHPDSHLSGSTSHAPVPGSKAPGRAADPPGSGPPQPGGAGSAARPALPGRAVRDLLARLRAPAVLLAAWYRRLRPAGRVTLVLALLATGFGSCALFTLLSDGSSCAPPLELRVLTDPDLEATVTAAAAAYLMSDANTDGDGCRRSGVTVYSAGSADAINALRRQTEAWREPPDEDTNPQRDVGPQPDVWIPASSADVARVTKGQDTDTMARLKSDTEPLAYSPIVLAVPKKMAATEDQRRVRPTLSQLLHDLSERSADVEVRRPDPEFTDAALLATTGLYGTGADPARAERQVAQPGPPSRTAADLLCALPEDITVDQRTAALVPEFLMKTGLDCDRTRRTPRMAEYPGDVPGIEPTFVRVRWKGADRDEEARGQAVGRFRDWLAGPGGRAVFARDGFRAADGDRDLLDPDHMDRGVLRAPSPLTEASGQRAMDTALTRYRGAHGPGRVLFLLDSSWSMTDQWKGASGGRGLLKQSLGGLGDLDEYGVWSVAGTMDGHPYEWLLDFGQHRRKDAERTIDAAKVRDAQADPRAALIAALKDMADRRARDDHPQLIVYITDDEDNSRLTVGGIDEVLYKAGQEKVPVTMVSLASGGCGRGRPDARISAVSGGRCLDADDDIGAGLADEVARIGTGDD
ncbi:substrate-binding domain-containing protein [Streptomyces sp. NPDC020490]|uniref:substrate-binding domain-containing protein n=1 Tax=Streptomyces sp. NPDC020490 TaxID=3365078 RepID=UPI0037AF90F5